MSHAAFESYASDLAYQHNLTLPQGRKLAELAIHYVDPRSHTSALVHLADPFVAAAFVTSPLGPFADEESVERIDQFARAAIERAVDTAGARYLRACVAEDRGDLEAQRAHLLDTLTHDPSFGPALADLGFLAFVAGEVSRADRLLAAGHGHGLDRMRHTLSHYPPRPEGRNQPCPCGSGKKAKHCCPASVGYPLADRATWLWEKVAIWLHRLPQHRLLVNLAAELADADPLDENPLVLGVLETPLLDSVALLDADLLGRFLERLGPLLPTDERTLAEQWRTQRHGVWVVESTHPGYSLRLRDQRTGQQVDAMNGLVSRCTHPGEIVYAPLVSAGDRWMLPVHPEGLSADLAEEIVEMLDDGVAPLAIDAVVLGG